MEEFRENKPQQEEHQDAYVPRPAWQIWAARVGLVLVIGFVAYQILSIATGGR